MEEDDKDLVMGATYVDRLGKRIRVTQINSHNVSWIDLADGRAGSTDLMQFVRHYYRTRDPDAA